MFTWYLRWVWLARERHDVTISGLSQWNRKADQARFVTHDKWRVYVSSSLVHPQRAQYEREDFWKEYEDREWLKRKATMVARLLPDGVKNVLDVGSGSGTVSALLMTRAKVVGVDVALTAVKRAPFLGVVGSASALPFTTGSFDCILCSEVLEHLTDEQLADAAVELQRVSRKFLLITVPDREPYEKNFVRCPRCGHVFNISGHLRAFSMETLLKLFPGTKVVEAFSWGPPIREYKRLLLWVRHKIGGKYSPLADGRRSILCPACGNTHFPPFRHNLVSLLCDMLNSLVSRRRPYWLFVLLKK